MTLLYRAFSYRAGTARTEPGGALYVPPQGRGRIDNPSDYNVYYAAFQPEAAVAEVLGAREPGPIDEGSLRGSPLLHGSALALATVQVASPHRLCDLDDPAQLIARQLRPSRVITKEYRVSQQWALRIYHERRRPRWTGVTWWSYYNSDWTSAGVWDLSVLKVLDIERLTFDHVALRKAALTLKRPVLG